MTRANETTIQSATGPLHSVRPGVAAAVWRVNAVIPCYNRPKDLEGLLQDLAGQELGEGGRVRLSVLIVDNASTPPLEGSVRVPEELNAAFLRLERNSGGSGGFNAGIAYWLGRGIPGDACELLWVLDSDARLDPAALRELIAGFEGHPGMGMVGSVLADPHTGAVFEAGGRVDFGTGEYVQNAASTTKGVVEVEYAAACSLLVRRMAVEAAGAMADVFLNGDDVEWCYRLSRVTGQRVGVATASRAIHPKPDRMRTGARYYAARNAFVAIREAARARPGRQEGDARAACGRRALRELARGLAQAMVGRVDLGELHIRGLEDAAAGIETGPAPEGRASFEASRPLSELPGELRRLLGARVRGRVLLRPGVLPDATEVLRAINALCYKPVEQEARGRAGPAAAVRALRRLLVGPEFGIGIVSARARADDWAVARTMITVADGGFVVREIRPWALLRQIAGMTARGLRARAAIMARSEAAAAAVRLPEQQRPVPRPSVSVVVLSFNRWEKLRTTLAMLRSGALLRGAQIIVADNGSNDGTVQRLAEEFPDVQVIALEKNLGVAAYNEAAARATGETLLILDDDSWPAAGAVEDALEVLSRRADIGAVTLLPTHPETNESEWPFAARLEGPDERWPVMGCGNLVRRDAWNRVGGYEPSFFLYRNDTDLAMKLLGAGYGVYFDPKLIVWHDSPAAAKKSLRWFELATRNWIWLCRRHGRGLGALAGAMLGWAWAHRLAGVSAAAHARILKGAAAGVLGAAGPKQGSGASLRRLLRLRFGRAGA